MFFNENKEINTREINFFYKLFNMYKEIYCYKIAPVL